MKRYLVALAAAGAAGTLVLGSAAALQVDGGQVQAGSDTDLACQEGEVRAVQLLEFDPVTPYSIGTRLEGIEADCAGNNVVVTIVDADGEQIAQSTVLGIPAGPVTAYYGEDVPIEDIEAVVVSLIS